MSPHNHDFEASRDSNWGQAFLLDSSEVRGSCIRRIHQDTKKKILFYKQPSSRLSEEYIIDRFGVGIFREWGQRRKEPCRSNSWLCTRFQGGSRRNRVHHHKDGRQASLFSFASNGSVSSWFACPKRTSLAINCAGHRGHLPGSAAASVLVTTIKTRAMMRKNRGEKALIESMVCVFVLASVMIK